jgi:hypothetical protein
MCGQAGQPAATIRLPYRGMTATTTPVTISMTPTTCVASDVNRWAAGSPR